MDLAHAILFAKKMDISRVTADYSSAKFEFIIREVSFIISGIGNLFYKESSEILSVLWYGG